MGKEESKGPKKQLSDEELSEMTLRYISSSQFIIPTKSILELERKIQTWLTIGACGSITYGRPRIGKTVCLNYIAHKIREKYNSNEIVIIWNITDHPDTERNFYASLLMAMGIECPKRDTALLLKERVLNELIMRACETPYRRVVIFLDEAWKLQEKDFSWLMDLYNNLNGKDIQLVAFLFGTRELKDLKTEFKMQGKDQIVGRFMINEVQFFGIRELSDMQFCLISLDKMHMRDALNSEISEKLLDFYFPNADGQNFFSLAESYWNAFQHVRIDKNILAEDLPMKYLIDSFNICLNSYGKLSPLAVSFPTEKELIDCVEMSGYGESDDEYERRKTR